VFSLFDVPHLHLKKSIHKIWKLIQTNDNKMHHVGVLCVCALNKIIRMMIKKIIILKDGV
jgi:hypothetical protein